MFRIEIKFKAGDREVSLDRFATLFLKELQSINLADKWCLEPEAR
jgi:hypothetical protein